MSSVVVVERDKNFGVGFDDSRPHRATAGRTAAQTVRVLFNAAIGWTADLCSNRSLSIRANDSTDDALLHTTLIRKGNFFSREIVMKLVYHLKQKHPLASIKFLSEGLGKNRDIDGVDPLSVIGRKKKWVEDQDVGEWVSLQKKEMEEEPAYQESVIVYPFVYPSKSFCSFPHVVLIVVDKKTSAIYYYDPQGLSSDDPSRLNLFSDLWDFNMHENLVALSKVLFPNQPVVRLIENLSPHQTDPVNCGTFVCRVIKNLYEGKSVEAALRFNPVVDSPLSFRREIGHDYLNCLLRKGGVSYDDSDA